MDENWKNKSLSSTDLFNDDKVNAIGACENFEIADASLPDEKHFPNITKRSSSYDTSSVEDVYKHLNTLKEDDSPQMISESNTDHDVKQSDEGYDSGNYYMHSVIDKPADLRVTDKVIYRSGNDGYVTPHLLETPHWVDTRKAGHKKGNENFLKAIFRSRKSRLSRKESRRDDISEKYYNPPSDIRDNYFVAKTSYPALRVLMSFLFAVTVACTVLFIGLKSVNPYLSFSVTFVLFSVMFVIALTLQHKSVLCVFLLLVPTLCTNRARLSGTVLLGVILILGPIIGMANKVHVASACNKGGEQLVNQLWLHTLQLNISNTSYNETNEGSIKTTTVKPFQKKCIELFSGFRKFCIKVYDDLQNDCRNYPDSMSATDKYLCKKDRDDFCPKISHIARACAAYTPAVLNTAESVRAFLFCLIPILILLLLSDAYTYNKNYLTTKSADNIYITQRIRKLDSERRDHHPDDLVLPLTRIEFQTYIIRGRLDLSSFEKIELVKAYFVLILAGLLSLALVLLEDKVHSTLTNSLNKPCKNFYGLRTKVRYRTFIYLVIGILFFLTMIRCYILRLRSLFCDWFYPDMIDVRSNHLYYKILHDRHSFERHTRRKIQLRAERKRLTRRLSCLHMIYEILPACVQMLCTKLCFRACMICDSITWKTVECEEELCQAHFCYECFVDAGEQCLTCKVDGSRRLTRTSAIVAISS